MTFRPSLDCLPMTSLVSTGGVWSVIRRRNSRKPNRHLQGQPIQSWSVSSFRTSVFGFTVIPQFSPLSTRRTSHPSGGTRRSVTVEPPCGFGVKIGGSASPFTAVAFWNPVCPAASNLASQRTRYPRFARNHRPRGDGRGSEQGNRPRGRGGASRRWMPRVDLRADGGAARVGAGGRGRNPLSHRGRTPAVPAPRRQREHRHTDRTRLEAAA